MDALTELNQALTEFQNPPPLVENEIRFYYDPVTRIGTRLGGTDETEPFVLISFQEYAVIAPSVASKFYLSRTEKVKPIPIAKGMRKLLESSDTGPYRTVKDCIIFADPNGPDAYQRREFDYD